MTTRMRKTRRRPPRGNLAFSKLSIKYDKCVNQSCLHTHTHTHRYDRFKNSVSGGDDKSEVVPGSDAAVVKDERVAVETPVTTTTVSKAN